FGVAPYLTSRLPDGLGSLKPEAGNAPLRLPLLDLRPRQARFFVTAAEGIVHGDAKAPRRVVGTERLTERGTETPVERAGDHTRESSGAQELRAGEAAAAIRGLEPHIRQLLIGQEQHV